MLGDNSIRRRTATGYHWQTLELANILTKMICSIPPCWVWRNLGGCFTNVYVCLAFRMLSRRRTEMSVLRVTDGSPVIRQIQRMSFYLLRKIGSTLFTKFVIAIRTQSLHIFSLDSVSADRARFHSLRKLMRSRTKRIFRLLSPLVYLLY